MASPNDESTEGRPYMPFHVGYLPEAIVAKAKRELGETEKIKAQALCELRELIEGDPRIRALKDDHYLLQFLRPQKFRVRKAFEQLRTSYIEKTKLGYLYDKSDSEGLMRTYGLKTIFCLPYRDKDGAVVFIVKMRNWNPEVSSANEFVSALTCACFLCTDDPVTQVCGIRVLIDVGGMTMRQVRCLATSCLAIISSALKNTLAARWVGIHTCNESSILPVAWSIMKLFLNAKIRSRVHFHGDKLEELRNFIPKAVLPVEYGGDNAEDAGSWFNIQAEKFLDRYEELCTSVGYR